MPRKPTPSAEPMHAELDHAALASSAQSGDTLTQLAEGYGAERDLLNQLLGQAQMAEAFGKFSQTVWSSKLAFVKENKLYQQLSGRRMPNGLELRGTWEEFCRLLGVSDEKANQDIANLRTFGEEALESMSQMGIGYRELRQFRRLPDDHKQALIEVSKTGDKEAVLELAETLIERAHKEKQELAAKLQDAEEAKAAKDAVIAKDSATITELREKLARPFKPKKTDPAKTAEDAAALEELFQRVLATNLEVSRLAVVVRDLQGHEREPMRERALEAMRHIVMSLREIVDEHGLDVDTSADSVGGRPSWLDMNAIAAAGKKA